MKRMPLAGALHLAAALFVFPLSAQEARTNTPAELLQAGLNRVMDILEPPAAGQPLPFTATLKLIESEGLPKEVAGRAVRLAWQAPDHLAVAADVDNDSYALGRDGESLWAHVASKKFGVVGQPGLPRFKSAPEKKDTLRLGPWKMPLQRAQVQVLPLLMKTERLPDEVVGGTTCRVVRATALPEIRQLVPVPEGEWRLALRPSDSLPVRIGYREPGKLGVLVELQDPAVGQPIPEQRWKIPARPGDHIETTALSHLAKFFPAALQQLTAKIPALPPATGERKLVASEGAGRLELHDQTRVLFLKGTPEEMGRQQGVLLKKPIRNLVNRIVYGVGVGSSFAKGRWFFSEIEDAQARLQPFLDPRHLREMDAMALAAGLDKEEARLANFFPELFHCSGFALAGEATAGGRIYHGRILDYLRGMGLEQNAVVMVYQPDQGNAWVNISYAGFVGTVTAMNEKRVAIGEMGGRGEGNWDGKPMAQLLREVMEKAGTLEEAVEILRKGPRTCEYYYVVSDGKSRQAVGIAATPGQFEVIKMGQSHPRLPHPFKDTVLLSAGDRYETLAQRVREGYGKFDADSARGLMTRPVCMKSNIHSVLFAPDTLDFWVANADSQNPASHTRYTRYNLAELLRSAPAPAGP